MAMGIGPSEVAILAVVAVVAGLPFLFWIWMIVDCTTKEPSEGNDKLIWIVVILLGYFIGALIYYFARRPQRIAKTGS